MAGRISNYPEFKVHFEREVEELKMDGHIVLNPAILPSGLTQQEYMSICIPMLHACDAIHMLKGWEESVGANIEYDLAIQAEKKIFFE